MLRGELLTLAELAQAEAKRRGDTPGPLSLARVLADREPAQFDSVFGDGSCAQVKHGRFNSSTDVSLEDILEPLKDGSVRTVADRLHEVLGDLTKWVETDKPNADGPTGEPPAPAGGAIGRDTEGSSGHPLLQPVVGRSCAAGHQGATAEVLAQLARRVPGNPLVIGRSGSGRTAFADGLQAAIDTAGLPRLNGARIVRLPVERLLRGDPLGNLSSALNALEDGDVAYVDDLEALLGLSTGSFFTQAAMRLREPLERPERRIVLALDETYVGRLEGADGDLFDELAPIALPPLPREDLERILDGEAAALAEFHQVAIPPETRRLALAPAPQNSRREHPGLAIDRLDAACARARLRGADSVGEADLALQETPEVAPLEVADLLERVREDVRGQDRALDRVLRRLALTRARLDLRPERPDAVLLLVGPTGVGKTQLARTLCRELFGDEERLIRLDMSEYADSWAISRLIGPQPGYVGYSEPDAWLTTRIRRQPRTVLLLDEIEKAHPEVWNTFLQVFDAGRLTDPRGNVADFADTVIVMTSNVGSEAFGGPSIGFAARNEVQRRTDEEGRVLAAVHATMRPELINRLDDIVVFSPLSEASIREIASREIQRVLARLTERGYRATTGPGVEELVATVGYDPKFGARHLQRNLERLLLMPLVAATSRSVRAEVDGEEVVWRDA